MVWVVIAVALAGSVTVNGLRIANAPGYHGVSGIVAADVLTVLAGQGFGSAVVLGEEAKQPRISVRAGNLISVSAIPVYFVLATNALSAYFGPRRDARIRPPVPPLLPLYHQS